MTRNKEHNCEKCNRSLWLDGWWVGWRTGINGKGVTLCQSCLDALRSK